MLHFFDSYTDVSHSTTGLPYAGYFYVICLILNTFILSKGIKGIEKVAKVGILLILWSCVLAVRGLTLVLLERQNFS
jgi:SNF family Na+-dependent transporter